MFFMLSTLLVPDNKTVPNVKPCFSSRTHLNFPTEQRRGCLPRCPQWQHSSLAPGCLCTCAAGR